MKNLIATFCIVFSFANVVAQCDDAQIQSFRINTNGELADYNTNCCPSVSELTYTQMSDSAGVTSIWYNTNYIFVNTNSLAYYTMGPWATAMVPADQDVMIKLPRTVTEDTSGDKNTAESGTIGVGVDGVSIFSETTSNSYSNSDGNNEGSGDGIWNEDAWKDEQWSLDTTGNGHTNAGGKYHYHASPKQLYGDISAGHSPIVGWGLDGVPIYGPYGYSDSMDANSAVVRMETGYSLRNITDRTTLPDGTVLAANQYGPSIAAYELGTYVEDYEHVSGQGHLDEHNGRFCVTPEYPSGVYAYFVTEDAAGEPVFPYFIGPEFYGETASGSSIPANASQYDPATCSAPDAAFSAAATSLCKDSSTTFTDASTNTPTSWTWTFNPTTVTYLNATTSSSQNPQVQFDAAGTYTVTLMATNASGSDSEVKSAYITVSDLPSAAGAITGSTSETENATGISYSIAAVSDATGYNWTVPSGASITSGSGTNAITVTFGTTSGNVEVTPTNACGNGTSASVAVTLTAASACDLGSTITSWSINTTGATANYEYYPGPPPTTTSVAMSDSSDVQAVCYDASDVYVRATGLASYTMGPWLQNPNVPSNQSYTFKFPRTPAQETGTQRAVPFGGAIGVAINGAVFFGYGDGKSYSSSQGSNVNNGDGNWDTDAWVSEGTTMDANGAGHPTGGGKYHYHATPIAFYSNSSTSHSPIVGYAFDGYPIYGPFAYSSTTDTTSAIVRMESGYALRNITTRTTLPDGSTSSPAGPAVTSGGNFDLGTYVQDYEYTGAGTLDEYNGRYCVTPEYPNGTYAYFVTIDAAFNPVFPYLLASQYYGVLSQSDLNSQGSFSTPSGLSCYDGSTCASAPVAAFSADSTSLCKDSSATFTDASTNSPTSWTWAFNPTTVTYLNSTSSSSQNPVVQFDAAGTYTVTLTATNAAGNDLEVKANYITVSDVPSAAGAITGSTTECQNATGVTYSIDAVSGATGYNWTVPSGASITSGSSTNTITVTFGTTSGNVEVTPTNSCGNGTASSTAVTLSTAPASTGAITGSVSECENATGIVYTVGAVTDATGYNWTVPTGASITSGSGTNTITVTFGTTAGNVEVTPTFACGSGTTSSIAVSLTAVPSAAGAITGSTSECENATGVTYSIDAVSGATGYTWTVPTGASITSGTSTNTITVSFGTTSGNVEVTPTNACGSGTKSSTAVTLSTSPSAAGAITGSTSVCENATGVTYSIAAVSGATGYDWTVPSGASITSGSSTNTITVTFGSTAGNVEVTPTNACGNGTSSSTTITLNPVANAAGAITGSTSECINATAITYSITPVTGATGYDWSIPSDASITSGSGTNAITVSFGIFSGNVEVAATNSCGNGTSSSTAVTLSATPSAAGSITGSTAECENATGVTYSIDAVSGATGYNWTLPTGASITNGAGTNTITVTFGTNSGNVEVTPTNSCGNGTAGSTAVTLTATPSAAGVITGSTSECENSAGVVYSISAVTNATGYNWTVPSGASITSGAGTNTITVTFGTTSGNVEVTPTNTCGNGTSSNLAVSLTSSPAATGPVTGSTSECENATGVVYSIDAVSGATGYNWSVPSDASITNGAGTNTITVTFGSTSGNVEVTPSFTCGNGTTSTTAVTLTAAPSAAGAITGSTSTCENATGLTYSIDAVTGATGYNWTVPTGASITSGSGTNTITVTFGSTTGNVTVTPSNSCGNGSSSSVTVALSTTPYAAGAITGSTNECESAAGVTYSITPISNATGYDWTVPAGASITSGSGTNSITVTFGNTSGYVSVTPTNGCGNGTSSSLAVTLNSSPAATGAITGSTSECVNATGITYGIAAVSGATGYNWTVPSGATITSGTGTTDITVTFDTTSGNVEVTPTFSCGNGTTSSAAVTLTAVPDSAGTITGSATECDNATGVVYTIDAVANASNYSWSVPSGATITNGAGTNTITVTFGTTSGNVSVTPTNTCGSGASSSLAVTITGTLGTAGAITGSSNVCENGTDETYSIDSVANATSYAWTVPSGATITSGDGTNSIVVDFATTAGNVSVTPSNSCSTGASSSLAVSLSTATSTPGVITGSTNECVDASGITYSVSAVSGATGYHWTVPKDATITNGQGTNAITVTFSKQSGEVRVRPGFACGNGTTSKLAVTIGRKPAPAGAITGDTIVCENATSVAYSIDAVNDASTYAWTLPAGASITSGAGTNSIIVDFATTSGNVSVTPSNSCGNSPSSSVVVTLGSAANAAGAITGASSVCENTAGVAYSIAAVNGAMGYNWTVPAGASIASGSGTNAITVNFGTTGGNVAVTPNSPCGNGTSSSMAVTINPYPSAAGAITGSTNECANATGITYSITPVSNATGYNWTVPSGASITSGTGTNAITVSFGTTSGNVEVTPTNSCGNGTSSNTAVTITSVPSAAGAITGATSECANATGSIYTVAAVTGATGYNWTVPSGASITSGTGTNTITVTFGTTSGTVSVTPTNTCGNGVSSSAAVTINTIPNAAGAITGASSTCNNATETYSIAAVTGATGYDWTVPSGASITSGAGTNTITVTFGTLAGNITVTPTNSCGNGTLGTTAVALSTALGATGSVTGSTSECVNATGVAYSIASVSGATAYAWTVPTGASIASGSGTNSITVNFGSTSGKVAVTPSNTCSTGSTRNTSVSITAIDTSLTLNTEGTIITSNESGATYQWVDCKNTSNLYAGETSQSITPTENGAYKVMITKNGCSAVSSCQQFVMTVTGIDDNMVAMEEVSIYPNPANNFFSISVASELVDLNIIITSSLGKIVYSGQLTNALSTISTAQWSAGTYVIQLSNDAVFKNYRLIKN